MKECRKKSDVAISIKINNAASSKNNSSMKVQCDKNNIADVEDKRMCS